MTSAMNPNKERTHFLAKNVLFQAYRFLVLNFKILVVMAKGHGGTR